MALVAVALAAGTVTAGFLLGRGDRPTPAPPTTAEAADRSDDAPTSTAPTTSSTTTISTTTAAPPSTSSTTLPSPTSAPTAPGGVDVRLLPPGLFCRDLAARGFDVRDALRYYVQEGRPDRMDASGNGVPCETVYPDAAAVWRAEF